MRTSERKLRRYARYASPLAKEKARQVKILLDHSPSLVPTVSELSALVTIDSGTLLLAFRELYACSIAHYQRQVKIQRIKTLLSDHSLTLETIAEETGYNGSPALIRFFKLMEGSSPGAWRREMSKLK